MLHGDGRTDPRRRADHPRDRPHAPADRRAHHRAHLGPAPGRAGRGPGLARGGRRPEQGHDRPRRATATTWTTSPSSPTPASCSGWTVSDWTCSIRVHERVKTIAAGIAGLRRPAWCCPTTPTASSTTSALAHDGVRAAARRTGTTSTSATTCCRPCSTPGSPRRRSTPMLVENPVRYFTPAKGGAA